MINRVDISSINLPHPSNVLLVIVKSTFLPSGENLTTRLLQYLGKRKSHKLERIHYGSKGRQIICHFKTSLIEMNQGCELKMNCYDSPTAHALIGYFEIRLHLTTKLFPTKTLSPPGQHCKIYDVTG